MRGYPIEFLLWHAAFVKMIIKRMLSCFDNRTSTTLALSNPPAAFSMKIHMNDGNNNKYHSHVYIQVLTEITSQRSVV